MEIKFNNITIDTNTFLLQQDGKPVGVEPKVFDLIVYLIENRNRVVSRDEILDHVWPSVVISDTSLSNRIKSARQVLGDEGQLQHSIRTVHGRGYQFVAEVKEINRTEQPTSEINKTLKPKRLFLILAMLAVTITIAYWYLAVRQTAQQTQPVESDQTIPTAQQSIAILPFSNTKPDKETDYLSFALANQIIGNLDYLEEFTIRPAGNIRKYTHKVLDPVEINKELKVDYILTGNYIIENSVIRLNVELINTSNNEIIWQEPIQVAYSDTFTLQDVVTTKVANGLKAKFISSNINRKEKDIPKSSLAYEYYLRSIAYPNTKQGNQLAIAMLENAIVLEPDYVQSQTQLGRRFHRLAAHDNVDMNGYRKAEDQLLKALALDNNSLRTLRYLVYLYTDMDEPIKALKMAQKTIAINPYSSSIYNSLARLYFYTGMNELAVETAEKAYKIDPKSYYNHNLGITYYSAGFYQKGVDFINEFDKDKSNVAAQQWLGMNYQRLGQNDKALEIFNNIASIKLGSHRPNYTALINIAILEENKTQGLKVLDEATHSFLTHARLLSWGGFYVHFGQQKTGLEMIRKAVEGGFYNIGEMQRNPFFDSIRDDKEFQEIFALAKRKHLAFKQAIDEAL